MYWTRLIRSSAAIHMVILMTWYQVISHWPQLVSNQVWLALMNLAVGGRHCGQHTVLEQVDGTNTH